jgi:hypothetical protein
LSLILIKRILIREKLLPVAVVSIFQDYLISVGVSPTGTVEMQMIAFPYPNTDPGTNGSSSAYALACTIRLLSKPPNEPTLSPIICHHYIGRERNVVSIWIRDENLMSSWLIFDFDVDFSNHPEQWVVNEETRKPKRILELWDSSHWALPLPNGKQFLSLGSVEASTEEKGTESERLLQLSIVQIDAVPSLGEFPTFTTEDEAEEYNQEQTRNYPRIILESPIRYLEGEEDLNSLVHSFDIEPWSGTLIVLLSTGDIWVLRYGHV